MTLHSRLEALCVQTDDANAARFGFVRVRNRQVGVVRRTAVRNDDRRVRYVRSVAIGNVEHLRHHDVKSSRRVGVGVEKPQSVQRTLPTAGARGVVQSDIALRPVCQGVKLVSRGVVATAWMVTGQLADAIGVFACLVFFFLAASARPRVFQSAS